MNDVAEPSAQLARAWIDDWNRHDLDAILSHYAADVVFRSATVVRRFGRPDGVVHGLQELRQHFQRGLALAPSLRFDLEEVFTCPGGYAVLYRRESDRRAIDVVELDACSRIILGTAHYAGYQP